MAIAATDDPAVVNQAETVIVLVKAGDTVPAMATIRPYVRADQIILTLQNGLGNAERIRSALGQGHDLGRRTPQAGRGEDPVQ